MANEVNEKNALQFYVSIDPTRQPGDPNIETHTYDLYGERLDIIM